MLASVFTVSLNILIYIVKNDLINSLFQPSLAICTILFFHKCLIQKVLPVRTASNECIKLAKSSFPQYVVFYPVLCSPYLQNILNFTSNPFPYKKSAILSRPSLWATTFFTNLYRIAAYGKQIRCSASARGLLGKHRAVLLYSGVCGATGAAAPRSGWPAR